MLPIVFGADWLVVVADFGAPDGADCVFWADGIELGEAVVDEDAAGADEFVFV